MKVLILAQSRSGSTGLTAWMKTEINEPVLVEPFNIQLHPREEIDYQLDLIKSDQGIIVKFVDNMFLGLPELSDVNVLMSYFDKVIGLTREDDYACSYSRLIGRLTDDWKGSSKNSSLPQEVIRDHLHKMDEYIEETKRSKDYILSLPIFQVTYEELYIRKEIDRLMNYLEIEPKNLDYFFENKNLTNNWNLKEFEYKYRDKK